MVLSEEGVDRSIDKEYKDNSLPILPSGSRGINVMEADISMLRREEISVANNNELSPENVMKSDDVLPTPSSLIFRFHGIDPWHQSRNFPIGRARMKMTPNPRIQNMSCIEFFIKLYFMDYIRDIVIPETKKLLNSAMKMSDYFCVIGCRLITACDVGKSVRDFFLNDTIPPQKRLPHLHQPHHLWEVT